MLSAAFVQSVVQGEQPMPVMKHRQLFLPQPVQAVLARWYHG